MEDKKKLKQQELEIQEFLHKMIKEETSNSKEFRLKQVELYETQLKLYGKERFNTH